MGTRLYVGNLPFTADETQIRELFAQNGRTVSEVKLVTDRETGRPRGFGFVEMGSAQDAGLALRFVETERRFDPDEVYGHAGVAKGTLKTPE